MGGRVGDALSVGCSSISISCDVGNLEGAVDKGCGGCLNLLWDFEPTCPDDGEESAYEVLRDLYASFKWR